MKARDDSALGGFWAEALGWGVSSEEPGVTNLEPEGFVYPDPVAVCLLALGYTNQEIGRKRYISVRTVDTHRGHIMRKLGLETRAELVLFALANGLIGPS